MAINNKDDANNAFKNIANATQSNGKGFGNGFFSEPVEPITKPNSDYMRLDLVVRKTATVQKEYKEGKKIKKVVNTKTIIKDYQRFLKAQNCSMTQYIHNLLDEDIKKQAKKNNMSVEQYIESLPKIDRDK